MSQTKQSAHRGTAPSAPDTRSDNLRDSPMMAHLLDALEKGTDVGHYGRLTFAMVARHFLDEEELVGLLAVEEHGEPPPRLSPFTATSRATRRLSIPIARAIRCAPMAAFRQALRSWSRAKGS